MIYRHAFPEEREQYLAMADSVFQGIGVDIEFEKALPKVYGKGVESAHLQYVAVDEDGSLCGLVAMLPCTMHAAGETLKMGYIGTVSVKPECRGRHVMRTLMNLWEQEARAAGADVLLLGGQRQRYRHYGFSKGGAQYTFTVSRRSIAHELADLNTEGTSFVPLESGSELEKAAVALHSSGLCWVERQDTSPSDGWAFHPMGFAAACRSYHREPWAFLKHGVFAGYCVASADGAALTEVHACEVGDVDLLLKAWWQKKECKNYEVTVPVWDKAVARRLIDWAQGYAMGPADLFRVLNWKHTVEVMLKMKAGYARLQDGCVGFCAEGQCFTVTVEENRVTVTDGAQDPLQLDTLSAGRLFLSTFPCADWPGVPENWFPLPFSCQSADDF